VDASAPQEAQNMACPSFSSPQLGQTLGSGSFTPSAARGEPHRMQNLALEELL